MKFLKLHAKSISISYKNSVCSLAFLFVFISTLASVIIPIIFVSLLSPYSGISESRILFEQPNAKFRFEYIFVGQNDDSNIIACSTFSYFNQITEEYQKCQKTKFWESDWNYDLKMDRANFELDIDNDPNEPFEMTSFYLILFFDVALKHKCTLKPPAVIIQEINVPQRILPSGEIIIKGALQLVQSTEFICPFVGRRTTSHFQNIIISRNDTSAELFLLENIRKGIQMNPAYFELQRQEIYFKKYQNDEGIIKIKLNLDIVEVGARYRLSVWEKLGQFWLYFASFFGISFYILGKMKDYLFTHHILRAWEVIPWKKLY